METKTCLNCKKTLPLANFSCRYKKNGVERKGSYCKKCHAEYRRKHYLKNKQRYVSAAVIKNTIKRNELRKMVFEYFKTHPCIDCGEDDPIVLEFDHRNIEEKSESISKLISKFAKPEIVEAEMAKCDVRCANCHRKRTAKQFKWYESLNYEFLINQERRPRRKGVKND
jgi:hypothetical protein